MKKYIKMVEKSKSKQQPGISLVRVVFAPV
jgi:hypothetical protein